MNHTEALRAGIGSQQRCSGQSCPSQRSAEQRVKTGAGEAGAVSELGAGGAFMVIPEGGCHRGVQRERVLNDDSGGRLSSSRTG